MLAWPDARLATDTEQPVTPAESLAIEEANAARMLRSIALDLGLEEHLSVDETEAVVLRQADQLLLVGNYADSAKLTRILLTRASVQKDATLLIRLALAEERRGNYVAAEKAYLQAVKQQNDKATEIIGLSGLARVWLLQKKTDEAIDLLSDLALQAATFDEPVPFMHGEILMLFAYAARDKALLTIDNDRYSLSGLEFSQPEVDLEFTIDLLQSSMRTQAPAGSTQSNENAVEGGPAVAGENAGIDQPANEGVKQPISLVARSSNSANEIVLDVETEFVPLILLLEQLGMASQLQVDIDVEAQALLSGRSKVLNLRNASLAGILDALLVSIDLSWQQVDGVITVVPSTSDSESNWLAVSERTWQQFLAAVSKDRRTPRCQFELGNLQLLKRNFDGSSAFYQTAIGSGAKGELAAKILLNHARLDRMLGRNDESIKMLYRAIDTTLDTQAQALAYYLMSQIATSAGEFRIATNSAFRAVSLAGEDGLGKYAVLALMRVYLLENKPFAANQALFKGQAVFQDADEVAAAAFLGSFARYIGSEMPDAKRSESYRLVNDLTEVAKIKQLSPIDRYLAARAYQLLGFDQLAVDEFQKALSESTDAYWQNRILFELAVEQCRRHEIDDALKWFEHLANLPNLEMAVLAKLQIVEIRLQQREFETCISACREILGMQLTPEQKRQTLQAMGLAYRQLNEPYAAALCFAGMLPDKRQ